jgi:hypothetical protein
VNAAQLTLIIDNLKRAHDHLATVPEERLDLSNYRRDTKCGTLFCAAGELSTVPYFADLGLRLERMGEYTWGEDTWGDVVWGLIDSALTGPRSLDAIFGPEAYGHLFATYGYSRLDMELMDMSPADWYSRERLGQEANHRQRTDYAPVQPPS